MTGRYEQSSRRKNVRRARRRRQTEKVLTAGIIAAILTSFIMVIGVAWKAAGLSIHDNSTVAEARTKNMNYDMQDGSRQDHQKLNTDLPWYLTLVNRQNPVPDNYEPELIEVQGGERVDKRIFEPLMEMLEAAKEGNLNQLPRVVSGYRTRETQQSLYDEKIAKYKREGYSENEARQMAEQWVAVPGYSEHQLGFAVDINGAAYDVYLWLQENSYKYGFIFRYPGNKTQITNVAEEVWHYRYVGVEAATQMHEQGVCLEEYLENGAAGN